MTELIVECINVHKEFVGAGKIRVLNGVDLSIGAGDSIAVEGASGSGKSTLLHILAGLDKPSEGSLSLFGKTVAEMNHTDLRRLRNKLVGVVYQFHHLLPEFSVMENVSMPLLIGGMGKAEAFEAANKVVARVGLIERAHHRPSQLSGGECQRAAIARALVVEPRLVLADEPTGNLDGTNAEVASNLLLELCDDLNTSVIVATHDTTISAKMNKIFRLAEGKLNIIS